MDSEASHLYVIVKVIMAPAVLAMPDQVAPPMTVPVDLLIADQVALAMQGQADQPMMVLVVQHIVGRVDQCHVHLVGEPMMVLVVQHIADRAARVMQGRVDHAIQALAEVDGHVRPFVANSKGMALSSAMLSLI